MAYRSISPNIQKAILRMGRKVYAIPRILCSRLEIPMAVTQVARIRSVARFSKEGVAPTF